MVVLSPEEVVYKANCQLILTCEQRITHKVIYPVISDFQLSFKSSVDRQTDIQMSGDLHITHNCWLKHRFEP